MPFAFAVHAERNLQMQLFDIISPNLFRPLAGPNRAVYAELLGLLWVECRRSADYSIPRAEAVSRLEEYFAALAKPVILEPLEDGAAIAETPGRDPHALALGALLRLRRAGWLEEQEGSYEEEPALAFDPSVAPLLDAMEEILNPRLVTYSGKLYKCWQLLRGIEAEQSPYENVLREVESDLTALNASLRAMNASIGHYIDRLTRNRSPQEVLELFDQYEERVVAAAYHRFKTSDNLFNYRAALEEGLDRCETACLPRIAQDYARVERCAPERAEAEVLALIQRLRDELVQTSELVRQIDESHIRCRKRAVQRAQFLLLSDRTAQGNLTALLRRYARSIRTPTELYEPDDGPVAKQLRLWPVEVFGEDMLYTPAAARSPYTAPPLTGEDKLDEDALRQEQELLLAYARLAVTEENVDELARKAFTGCTAENPAVRASALAGEAGADIARIIGLHTYSATEGRCYELHPTGEWVESGGFRFEDFVITPKMPKESDAQ